MSEHPAGSAFLSHKGGQFITTHWSVVTAAAGDLGSAMEALEQLCRAYWYPLYAFSRRKGYGAEDAKDLTQAFFERMISKKYLEQADRERGKFRTFLLSAFNHFIADERDRAMSQKRGGGIAFVEFDGLEAEERYRQEPIEGWDAQKLYDRRWATTLIERALRDLERESSPDIYPAVSRFMLAEPGDASYSEVAPTLGMSVAAMKMKVSRLRARCRELIRDEICRTVMNAEQAEEEYRALMAALRD